jgi:HAD superfamily hydrolase (TIGR01549 family)
MRNRDLRAVLFDWDGTLVDTAESTYRSYIRMFAEFGITFDRDTYARTYSPDWHYTYRCVGLPEEKWSEADAKWHHYFSDETTHLIEDAAHALERLTSRGIICGVVTAGTRSRIVRELSALGVDRHFIHVVCGDDGHQRKPHPEALSYALEQIGVDARHAAYVGDTAEDMMMARAAGVFSVGICGPYPNHDSLRAANPDVIAHSITEAIDSLL